MSKFDIFVADNEQMGIYIEKIFCNISNIPFNTKRSHNLLEIDPQTELALSTDIQTVLDNAKIVLKEHIGGDNGKTDFYMPEGKTFSLKALSSSTKICPQVIGQTTRGKLASHFGTEICTGDDFKEFVANNLGFVIAEYLRNTFICDTTTILMFKKRMAYVVTKNEDELKMADGSIFLNKPIEQWNESATAHLMKDGKAYPIGEFQVHKNRNSCKFRFYADKIIENNLVHGIHATSFKFANTYDIGKKDKENMPARVKPQRECPTDKIVNPSNGRFVKRTGKIGREILRMMSIAII